jgi:UDP-hydrolysing UDP-N-acetyl-D-glucosamine 2-epimerase
MGKPPLLEIIVTARPSWARVKSLAVSYYNLAGTENLRLTFIGPAVSDRYGNVSVNIPKKFKSYKFQSLQASSDLNGVALTCVDSSRNIINHWTNNRPDCALIIADRTETLGIALAASLMQIPLIHLQGGEISGSIDDKIRDANSKLADLHLTTNEFTKSYLIGLGENENRIIPIGCPSIDLVSEVIDQKVKYSEIIKSFSSRLGGVGADFSLSDKFGIVMFHPDTYFIEESFKWIDQLIKLVEKSKMNWLWFWPNPDYGSDFISNKIRSARERGELKNVRFIINLEPEIFITLTLQCQLLVGNSSYGIRESSYIGLRALNVGSRQNGRQQGKNVTDVNILTGQNLDLDFESSRGRTPVSNLYGDGTAGKRGAEIIYNWMPSIKKRIS